MPTAIAAAATEKVACFFNPSMFSACVEEETVKYDFPLTRNRGSDLTPGAASASRASIKVDVRCVHGENQFI